MTTFHADDPRHGTYAGVKAHDTHDVPMCEPCAEARYLYTKRMKRRLAHGQRNRIPLGERAHRILAVCGGTAVGELTGINRNNLYRLTAGGPDQLVLRDTRDRILAATPRWTYIGVQRRLQGLMALGYSARFIADELGADYDGVLKLSRRSVQVIKHEYAERICDLYDRLDLVMAPPSVSSNLARQRALRNGFLTPAAWDDIDFDEAPAINERDDDAVDPLVVERIVAGQSVPAVTRAERLAVYETWLAAGRSVTALAKVTGWNVHRDLQRLEKQVA